MIVLKNVEDLKKWIKDLPGDMSITCGDGDAGIEVYYARCTREPLDLHFIDLDDYSNREIEEMRTETL